MRGEYYLVDAFPLRIRGSPPRAWGIRGSCAVFPFQFRFTPTCVGNTRSTCSSRHSVAVHPHVRGEYTGLRAQIATRVGSPPRAWGILIRVLHGSYSSRFTPTCVGNTGEGFLISAPSPVHPHVRGEYEITQPTSTSPYGSPPRAWGIHENPGARRGIPRFTPTCVGNTDGPAKPSRPGTVHPHVRGEYYTVSINKRKYCGSPPRAWGIQLPVLLPDSQLRFTPTCVGNTVELKVVQIQIPVHPHVRGEYGALGYFMGGGLGSPPRAWGILEKPLCHNSNTRFTPTCVGNTWDRINTQALETVHPHVRGEYKFLIHLPQRFYGSPPRAWGIRIK